MNGPRRFPSTPGIPGQHLPTPDSVPPEERIMREIFALEGRMVSRLGDQHTEAQQERREICDQMAELRDQVSTLARGQQELTAAVLSGQRTDVDLTRDVGKIQTKMVAAGRAAGGKRGILAAIGTVLAAIGGKWLAQKLGIDL